MTQTILVQLLKRRFKLKRYTCLFISITLFSILSLNAQLKGPVIIDADTANEVDDLFALVCAFAEPSWNIIALNATQWQASQSAVEHTMEASHKLNKVLTAYVKKTDQIKLLRGGFRRMYDWGDKAQHSAATYEIIKQAHAQKKEGQKLSIIALGALTNVASALFIDPDIGDAIELYWLGSTYDFDNKTSKLLDYNSVMDVQAVEILLTSQVAMHIMPVNVVQQMKFSFSETQKKLEGKHPMADFLLQTWFNHHDGGRYERVLWDVALIAAISEPELAQQIAVKTFDNHNIKVYNHIDEQKIIDFTYKKVLDLIDRLNNND